MVRLKKGQLVAHVDFPNKSMKLLTTPGKGELPDELTNVTGLIASIENFGDKVLCTPPIFKMDEDYRPMYLQEYHYNNAPCIVVELNSLQPYNK